MTKFVYLFEEGNANMRDLLGGKGAGLAEMTNLGMPVPRGFTITSEACNDYYAKNKSIADNIREEISKSLDTLQEETGKELGNPEKPLLVSVRSGARASMPGMMDTVLNLGLNDQVVEGLASLTDNRRFAYDSYRRFIMMFADVVMEIDKQEFESILDAAKAARGVEADIDLTAEDLEDVTHKSLARYEEIKGEPFPQDPIVQLYEAVEAVFRSWDNPRAQYYRRMNNIPHSWGTAVNVQEMVYGNMGNDSGSGVAFSRSPSIGDNHIYGEFLPNAQGEDVVAGVRTPVDLEKMKEWLPEVYDQFTDLAKRLESHYGDMQDIEFTIEKGKLFLLQTRNGKRTAQAAMKIAVDMYEEGLVSKERALMQINPVSLDTLLHPRFSEEELKKVKPICSGLPASPGAASGSIVFDANEARKQALKGRKVILIRQETSPEDIEGMNLAQGILTARGGMTSHAAVVARGMGKPCITGCSSLLIDEKNKTVTIDGVDYKKGDILSLDGSTGQVYADEIPTVDAEIAGNFETIMEWAKEISKMNVRANADKAEDVAKAIELGAGGVGLTRTEHMFFEKDRIFDFRKMILSKTKEEREEALKVIQPIQESDFEGIFRALNGLPATIRLLDPPLHEFLPKKGAEINELAESMGMKPKDVKKVIKSLQELNPMLGMRGCRLAIIFPEIPRMQTAAIIQAAINVYKEGIPVHPEIMVPLISTVKELHFLRQLISEEADRLIAEAGVDIHYTIGTMIEIPRAALTADEIGKEADFFSFGTNDLTQMGFGLSRDDAGRVLDAYYKQGIFENDPTAVLDQKGVGRMMDIAAREGRAANPNIHLGVCGEHGGEPSSVKFCQKLDFDYVSCSPFRVPIAILSAAQAEIESPREYLSSDLKKYFGRK
ncbi:MAG: pyruvate, phosphate dikinase [Eubacteriales bacterium]|nr:pyruvate, phosphate dikinase [Eubacteriales bacterium]